MYEELSNIINDVNKENICNNVEINKELEQNEICKIIVSKNLNFYCEKCDIYFNYKSFYNKHLTTNQHTNNERKLRSDKGKERKKNSEKNIDNFIIKKQHTCNICDYKTINIHNYENHILNNHSSIEDKEKKFTFYCKVCNFGVFTKSSYDKHLETKKHYIKIKNI